MSSQKPAKTNVTVKGTENEVERARDMGEWRKVLELIEAGRAGKQVNSGPGDILANFLHSEAKLEIWLEDSQPLGKVTITKSKSALIDVKKGLQLVLSHTGDQSGLKTDVRVLLAKVYFTSGLYEEALDELDKSGIMGVSETGQSVRNLQLMAESHAIRAHSLEKVGKSLRGKNSLSELDRKKEILRCYNRSGDLAIQFFQGQEKIFAAIYPPNSAGNSFPNVNITLNSNTTSISPPVGTTSPHPQTWEKRRPPALLDNAIRKGPALLVEDGKIEEAILRIHKLCRSYDTHYFTPIRLGFYRRLAELQLRHKFVCSKLSALETSGTHIKFHSSSGLYTPQNVWEDIILTLLLGESLVVKEGVLNQSPEFEKARKLANANAAAVYDLLSLAAARWSQFQLVNEGFENSLKFSFEEPHIWSQYALTFVAAGRNSRKSYQTLVEAGKLSPKPTSLLLLAAQQAFSQFMTEEGLQLIQTAKEKELEAPQKFLSRVLLHEGIGYFLRSFEKHMNQQRSEDRQLALASLQKAAEMDPLDHLTLHWLARVYAWTGNIDDAFNVAVKALRAFPFHLPTLQLIILLLSAQRNYSDALAVTEEALDEYPDHLGFLQMKAALDQKIFGPEAALSTVRQMLVVWKGLFEDNYSHVRGDSPDQKNFGPFGNLQLPSPPAEREGGSVASFRATSIAGSSTNPGTLSAGFRADSALSEIASSVSMNGFLNQVTTGELAWAAQINIWIMLTDLYLKLDQPVQAGLSVEEASQIASAHPDVLFYRGQIEEHEENYTEARLWYESAVGVKPTHVKALQSLALMQHYFGSHRLAEKTLQDALKLDPYDHHTWYNLGKVLEALKECSEAGDCMATALKIEAMNPILPYSVIPVCFE